MKYAIIAGLLFFATPSLAGSSHNYPDYITAKAWLQECQQKTRTCYGFVQGVIETAKAFSGPNTSSPVCLPEDLQATVVAEYVLDVIQAPGNAGMQETPFTHLILDALSSSYPCQPL